jgi:hypothetical protein
MNEKYFLLTKEEYEEVKSCIQFALEIGYKDMFARFAEDLGSLYSIGSIMSIAERSQQERIQSWEVQNSDLVR